MSVIKVTKAAGAVLVLCISLSSAVSRLKRGEKGQISRLSPQSSHDDAYNAIISQYYVTDPFFQSKRENANFHKRFILVNIPK